jgi:hypothetical protein
MFGTGLQKSTAILLGIKVTDFEGKIYCKAYLPTVDSLQPNIFGCLPKKIECDPVVVGHLKNQDLPVSQFGYLADISYSFKSASKDSLGIQIHKVDILGYYEIDANHQPFLRMLQPATPATNGVPPVVESSASPSVPASPSAPVAESKDGNGKSDSKSGRNFA